MSPIPVLLAALALQAAPADADLNHRKIYEQVAGSVVAIRAVAPLGERSGSGVLISDDGLILTSYSTAPDGASRIRVWAKGPRRYEADLVATSKKDEMSLLRIRLKDFKERPVLRPLILVDSEGAKLGDLCYTVGNAANSIINDDAPSFNVGVLSARYPLDEQRANSTYVGPVLETTAAVNVGMEGAPLLDGQGRMIGFITLNYSPHRFLGAAIPSETVRQAVERMKLQNPEVSPTASAAPAARGRIGATFAERDGKIVVVTVDKGGAAASAGLAAGMQILAFGDAPLKSLADLNAKLDGLEAGTIVYLRISADGADDRVRVELQEAK